MPAAYPNMAEDFDQLLDKANRAEERGHVMPHRQAWNEITDELLILRIVPGARTAGDIEVFAKRSPLYGRSPLAQIGSNRYYAALCRWAADYVYQFDGKALRAYSLARRFYSSVKRKLMNQSTLKAIARQSVRKVLARRGLAHDASQIDLDID